jgi:hypothetical protein
LEDSPTRVCVMAGSGVSPYTAGLERTMSVLMLAFS